MPNYRGGVQSNLLLSALMVRFYLVGLVFGSVPLYMAVAAPRGGRASL